MYNKAATFLRHDHHCGVHSLHQIMKIAGMDIKTQIYSKPHKNKNANNSMYNKPLINSLSLVSHIYRISTIYSGCHFRFLANFRHTERGSGHKPHCTKKRGVARQVQESIIAPYKPKTDQIVAISLSNIDIYTLAVRTGDLCTRTVVQLGVACGRTCGWCRTLSCLCKVQNAGEHFVCVGPKVCKQKMTDETIMPG